MSSITNSLYNPTRYTGLGSGMDIDNIVKGLMDVERMPLHKLTRQKTSVLWQREDYRSMNSALTAFRSATDKLRFTSGFETKQVTSSNVNAVEVTGSSSATTGYNSIKVLDLATSASITGNTLAPTTNSTDLVTVGGEIKITGSKGTSDPIVITQGTSTIDSIISEINAQTAKTGVKANFDSNTKRLFLTTETTGADSKISIEDNSGAFQTIFNVSTLTSTGKNAKFEYNDAVGANALESATNSFTLNGLTFNLKSTTTDPVSLTVAKSTDAALDNIKEFINQYNSIVDKFFTASSTRPDKNYQPLLDEEKEAMTDKQIEKWEEKSRQGTLYNDSVLKGALDEFRKAFRDPIKFSDDTKGLLSSIGITVMTDAKQNGKLKIDEEKLKNALSTDMESVKDLFTHSSDIPSDTLENKQKRFSELGFAERIYESINNQINKINKKVGFGSLESIDDSVIGEQLKLINNKASSFQDRLSMIESRYYKKFSAMESALQSLNNKGSWLTSQLSSM